MIIVPGRQNYYRALQYILRASIGFRHRSTSGEDRLHAMCSRVRWQPMKTCLGTTKRVTSRLFEDKAQEGGAKVETLIIGAAITRSNTPDPLRVNPAYSVEYETSANFSRCCCVQHLVLSPKDRSKQLERFKFVVLQPASKCVSRCERLEHFLPSLPCFMAGLMH